jgi:hypothetical protein
MQRFATLNQLSTRLGLNYHRAMALQENKVIVPDGYTTEGAALYKVERFNALVKTINEYGLAKATRARQAELKTKGPTRNQ